jgi:hypothetical protein
MNENAIQITGTEQEAITKFNELLGPLLKAAHVPVTDQASLIKSGDAKVSLEAYIKAVKNHFERELTPLEERVKRIKNNMISLMSPAKESRDKLVESQRGWMAEEKRKAELERQREQERVAAEQRAKAEADRREAERIAAIERKKREAEIEAQRKSGEVKAREAERLKKEAAAQEAREKELAAKQAIETATAVPTVRVAPSIPTVAGVKNQTFYFAEVTEPDDLIAAFASACTYADKNRRDFLCRFIAVNEAEVGKYAREVKNSLSVMGYLPGVKAWSKG